MGEPAAVSGKYLMVPKSAVDEVVAKGASYDDIMDNESNGAAFTAEELTKLNSSSGIGWYWADRTPGTEYIAMAKVKDAAGNSTLKYAVASTDPAGEASDAYKAWLGTWTVTSTSSEVNAAPLSFDVVIGQKAANSTYSVLGWDITAARTSMSATANFNADNGTLVFPNYQLIGTNANGPHYFLARAFYEGDGYYLATENYDLPVAMLGTLDSDKTKATVTVGGGTDPWGDAYVGTTMAIYVQMEGNKWGSYGPAEGFTKGDYPIGPFTMVKKSTSSSVKSAGAASTRLGNLSSVLSVKAGEAALVKPSSVMSENRVAMPSSLVFDRPAASGTVIGNSGKFENAGLKKQISNNLDNSTDFQLLNRL